MIIGKGVYLERLDSDIKEYILNPPVYCPKCGRVVQLFQNMNDIRFKSYNPRRNLSTKVYFTIDAGCKKCVHQFKVDSNDIKKSNYSILKPLNVKFLSKKAISNLINTRLNKNNLVFIFDEKLMKESKRYAISLFENKHPSVVSEEEWFEESLVYECWNMNLHSSYLYQAEANIRRHKKLTDGCKIIKTQGLRKIKEEDEE